MWCFTKRRLHESWRMGRRIVVMKLIFSLGHCGYDGHTIHKLSQRRLTADWLAPRESDCSWRGSKICSDWLPNYIKVTRPILEILKMAGYFPDSPCIKVIQKVSTVCAYLSRILETLPLHMCSDFLYHLRNHRRHFVTFVLCLYLFLCVKHVWDNWRGRRLWNMVCNSFFESQECATKWDSSPDLSSVWWQCDEWWHG